MNGMKDISSQSLANNGLDTGLNGEFPGSFVEKPGMGPAQPKSSFEMTIVVEKDDTAADGTVGDSRENLNKFYQGAERQSVSCVVYIERVEQSIKTFLARNKRCIRRLTQGLALIAFLVYFVYCMTYSFGDEGSFILIGWTIILMLAIVYRVLSGRCESCSKVVSNFTCPVRWKLRIRYALYVIAVVGLGAYIGSSVLIHNPQNAQSFLGIFGIILLCFALSQKPSKINWHPVFWGFVLQLVLATVTMRSDVGYKTFMWLGDAVQHLLQFSDAGSRFVLGETYQSMGLAFRYAGALIFFGSLMGILIHYGIIGFIVIKGGRLLSFAMGTGPVESIIAVANIFIGLSSAPLLILPYLPTMSMSELGALMTCGYASVSGEIMALFIASGAPPNHLLTAAIMSAPAALAVSKLLMPETEHVDFSAQLDVPTSAIGGNEKRNALSAASDGALVAMRIAVSSMVNMLAFVSLLALFDSSLEFFASRAGFHGLTFDAVCGYLLFPLAYAMGTPYDDCGRVGSLIGVKLVATPVVGFAELGKIINNRKILEDYTNNENGTWHWEGSDIIMDYTNTTLLYGVMSEKAEAITTYAMCGFSAFTAIGISLGAYTSLCPSRKMDIIKLVPMSFLGGNIASFATGAVAGLLHSTH